LLERSSLPLNFDLFSGLGKVATLLRLARRRALNPVLYTAHCLSGHQRMRGVEFDVLFDLKTVRQTSWERDTARKKAADRRAPNAPVAAWLGLRSVDCLDDTGLALATSTARTASTPVASAFIRAGR